jgi:flagellar motility protein MotE (MotC chaperone)
MLIIGGIILDKMDATTAAKLTEIMEPSKKK